MTLILEKDNGVNSRCLANVFELIVVFSYTGVQAKIKSHGDPYTRPDNTASWVNDWCRACGDLNYYRITITENIRRSLIVSNVL